jgi:hypothetical protein
VIDSATDQITIPVGTSPIRLAMTPDGLKAYTSQLFPTSIGDFPLANPVAFWEDNSGELYILLFTATVIFTRFFDRIRPKSVFRQLRVNKRGDCCRVLAKRRTEMKSNNLEYSI